MRRGLLSLTCLLASVFLSPAQDARAQDVAGVRPASVQVEIFGGYSVIRANTVVSGASFSLSGADLSLALYVKDWLGIVGELGRYSQSDVAASGFRLNLWDYQVGPRLRLRTHTQLAPFAQFLLGGGSVGGSLYTRSLSPGVPPLRASGNFLLTAGGGVDWKPSPRIGIRLVQAEWLYSQFPNGSGNDNRQDNLRLSTGLVFTLDGN